MPTLPHIVPWTHNTPCLEYPCRLANLPVAFAAPIIAVAGKDKKTKCRSRCCYVATASRLVSAGGSQVCWSKACTHEWQKYFQLLGKVPQNFMVNFTDIIAQCTIAAARNNSDPYTEMKDAILQFTTKPTVNGHSTLTSTHCSARGH